MNKYQEALNVLKKIEEENTYKRIGLCNHTQCDIIQELIDQNKTPTIEEVKKEWEELGYKIQYWNEKVGFQLEKEIYKDNSVYSWHTIYINAKTKEYYKHNIHLCFINFTFQEHQLLTKTFRALGWFDVD